MLLGGDGLLLVGLGLRHGEEALREELETGEGTGLPSAIAH